MTNPSYAVFQKKDGALCALSTSSGADSTLVKVSNDFRSIGRAIVEKQKLEKAGCEVRHAS